MSVLERFRLDGKRALVTGASRGLGRAMALAFAEAGADVVITGRTAETLDAGGRRDPLARATGLDGAGRHGRAGRVPGRLRTGARRAGPDRHPRQQRGQPRGEPPIETESLEVWQRSLDLNLTSCFLGTKLVGQAMLERGRGGRIINIASIGALIAVRGIGGRDYETSKAAVLHFTRCAAADWAPHGITVNAICPGLFMTDMNRDWAERRPDVIAAFVENIPLGRPGEPDEIGPLAVFLASPASAYVTGAAFLIDGGYTAW